MHARSIYLASVFLSLVTGAGAQGFDPEAIAEGLTRGDTAAIQSARGDAIEYLSGELRVSERLAADEALGDAVAEAIASDDEFRVVNGLLVAGYLVTPTSLQKITPFLTDDRPGVRYAAYKAMRVSMDTISEQASPSLQPDAALSAFGELEQAATDEIDPALVEAGLRAIAAATSMSSTQMRPLEDRAALALPTLAQAHVLRLGEIGDRESHDQTLGAILYAMLELRISLSNPSARMSDQATRAAAKLGGDLIAYAFQQYEREQTIAGLTPEEREPLQQAIAASENLVYFALNRLGADVDRTTIAESFQNADDRAFRSGVLRVIGPTGSVRQAGIEVAGGPGAG